MSLVCNTCRNAVPEGLNRCRACNNGFVSQLACAGCGSLVERGAARCDRCESQALSRIGRGSGVFSDDRELVIQDAGRFGVTSRVQVPEDVVGLFSEIASTGQGLMRLASKLASYASTPGTRDLVRGCRELAMRLQEELESRRGGGL